MIIQRFNKLNQTKKSAFKDSLYTERTISTKRGSQANDFSNIKSMLYKSMCKSKSKTKSRPKKSENQNSNSNFIVINFLNTMESVNSSPLVNIMVQKGAKQANLLILFSPFQRQKEAY